MPASAQMTELPINTNTMNGGMRVEGRVTCPSESTPTERRYAEVMRDDEAGQGTTRNDEKRGRTTSARTLTIVLRLYKGTMIGQLQVQ